MLVNNGFSASATVNGVKVSGVSCPGLLHITTLKTRTEVVYCATSVYAELYVQNKYYLINRISIKSAELANLKPKCINAYRY